MKTVFGKRIGGLLGLLWGLSLLSLQAQTVEENVQPVSSFVPSPVTVSAEFDTLEGVVYRVHVVQSGHTLYSIARAYNVARHEIVKQSLGDTVRIGERLYIPYMIAPEPTASTEPVVLTADTVVKVQFADTVVEQPVPDTAVFETPADSVWGSDSLAIEADSLLWGDSTDMAARLFLWGQDTLDLSETPTETLWDSLFAALKAKKTVSVSILLPLYLNDTNEPPRSYTYLPFLEGWLTAYGERLMAPADSMMPEIRYRVWDVTDSPASVDRALNDPALTQADFLIAAVYTKVFDTIRRFAEAHRLPLIHPLTEQDSMAAGNPFYIQCMPSYGTQAEALARFLKREFAPEHYRYILFDDSTGFFRKRAQLLTDCLMADTNVPCDLRYYSYSPARMGQLESVFDTMFSVKAARPTVFIGCTDKEIALLNTLIALRKGKGTAEKIFIGPSRWMSFTKIEPEYFKKIRLVCYQPFYWDKNGETSLRFERHYFQHFDVLPSDMAYKGYACFNWFAEMLRGGEVTADPFACHRWQTRTTEGWENTRLFFLELKDQAFTLWPEPEPEPEAVEESI
ncbi:MAG: LysM peptidoglycan-binding domain-containing protein [Bacteroidales bacterium]|nr:LysM peptidoglycan-binding domain-containing protein [Bacteroidales bacterium]